MQLFSFFGTAGGSSAEGTTHDMALTPGLPLLLALALAFYCLWRAQVRGDTRPAAKHLYTATGFAVLTLVLSLHAFPWDFVEGWFGPAVGKVVGMFPVPVPLSLAGHAAAPALRTDLWQSCRIRYIKGEVFSDY